jgi:hypothetical protein
VKATGTEVDRAVRRRERFLAQLAVDEFGGLPF